jgi:hypothetical protein
MADRRLEVGESVLVSRAQNGADHEEVTVIDFYELLIGDDKIPMVVVDFDDGHRMWVRAEEPDVIVPEPEPEPEIDDFDDEDDDDDEVDHETETGDAAEDATSADDAEQ